MEGLENLTISEDRHTYRKKHALIHSVTVGGGLSKRTKTAKKYTR